MPAATDVPSYWSARDKPMRSCSFQCAGFFVACLVASTVIAAEQTEVSIKALDPHGKVLPGIRFTFAGVQSLPTDKTGVTDLQVPPLDAGESIKVDLPSSLSEEWFLVDSMVHAPAGLAEGPVEVVLMRRADLRVLAGEARDAAGQASRPGEQISEAQRHQILIDYAAQYGLSEEEFSAAILAFGQTDDPMDRGIAEYLAGEYAQAEESLLEAVEARESDYLEPLRYLGATQYAQGDYPAAVGTFRKAVGLRANDLPLLGCLGNSLYGVALWRESEEIQRRHLELSVRHYGEDHPQSASAMNNLAGLLQATNRLAEAEPLMRRALEIDQASHGKNHPGVAIDLNNLALLLQATNRLAEAELLMRRALEINQASYGEDHPYIAISLNNLALLLLATNRLAEAESLMRRARGIDQASYGDDNPNVARDLNNLAQLLQATNRLAEAEPLMRRALEIDQASYGEDHPDVAIDLNNLALLLKATNRLAEAEPLMRRALEIGQASYGEDHPGVAIDLNNLALLLKVTNRLAEAEPLMRRALEIGQASYGEDHPRVAINLNNLAQLLQATNRLAEAEPLMRRALEIFEASLGPDHPDTRIVRDNLEALLAAKRASAPVD